MELLTLPRLARSLLGYSSRKCTSRLLSRRTTGGFHTVAICRDIPLSFVDALSMNGGQSASEFSITKAKEQHEHYVQVLQQHVSSVVCLPAVEAFSDCVFVEDTVVAIGATACLTRLGAPSRQGEGDALQETLAKAGISRLVDMNESKSDAICDGGDVLYTGRHLFVGLTNRTNQEGARVLQEAFHDLGIPIVPVVLFNLDGQQHALHLKSAVTHIDEATLLAPEGELGDRVLESTQAVQRGYTIIRLPDMLACNVVVVNTHILAQDTKCIVSKERIVEAARQRDLGLTFVDTSELAKKDGALTCCSVLLSI